VASAFADEDGEFSSGDGIVVSGRYADPDVNADVNPGDFNATILNSEISGAARAGALFERATVVMSGVVFENNGIFSTGGAHGVSQDLAEVSGTNEVLDLDNTEIDALAINRALVQVDQLGQ
jgi:hypothetical protein